MSTMLISINFLIIGNVMAQESYYINGANDTQLFIREFGSGKPLILLAGGPGLDVIYMQPVWKKLASKYRCIVPDQRGTGKSILSEANYSNLTNADYTSDLELLRQYLSIDKLTIIGHSWGGMLAMDYVSKYPDHVDKLILLNSGGITLKDNANFMSNIRNRLTKEDKQVIKEIAREPKLRFWAYWPGYFYDHKQGLKHREYLGKESLSLDPVIPMRTMISYGMSGHERLKKITNFNEDVILIYGRQDPIAGTADEITEKLSQSELYYIENCGHFPWLEKRRQRKYFFRLLFKSLE